MRLHQYDVPHEKKTKCEAALATNDPACLSAGKFIQIWDQFRYLKLSFLLFF